MTVTTDDRSGIALTAGAGPGGRRDGGATVRIIQIYAVLLVLIPPTQIIGPLGAIGTPATVVALVGLVLWGVAVLRSGDHLCRTVVPVRVVMGLVVGTILLGYAVLHVGYAPGGQLLGSDRAMLQVLSWAGVGLLAAEGLRDRDDVYRVLRTLVAAVAVMAVVGFLQFRFGTDLTTLTNHIPGLRENADLVSIQDRAGFRRSAGTATHPIEFGCVIAMVLPVALHLARFDLARSPFRRWLPAATIAIGIPVAVSRSAVLGAVVAGVIIFIGLEPRVRPRALGAAAAFIVVIYATTPGLLGTLRNLFVHAGSDSSITYRTRDYEMVGEYIRQSPWIGQGPGTFLADINNNRILDNQYLLSAIEIGLVGLTVVLVYLLAAAFLGRGARRRTSDPAIRDLGQTLAATSVASAVTAFTFDAFSFLMFAGVIALCLGLAGDVWMRVRAVAPGVNDERPPQIRWADTLQQEARVGVLDPPADDLPAEGVAPWAGDVSPPVTGTLTYRDDAEPAMHHPGPDHTFQELATSDAEAAFAITAHPAGGQLGGRPARDNSAAAHDLRRVVALTCAGVAVVVLAALPFTMDRGSDDQDIAAAGIVTSPMVTPTSTSSSTTTTTERPSRSAALVPSTTPARQLDATTTSPSSDEDTVATGSGSGSLSFPSTAPAPSPTAAPTATTTPGTAPTTPTTVQPTTTTITTTTTTITATTTIPADTTIP